MRGIQADPAAKAARACGSSAANGSSTIVSRGDTSFDAAHAST